jgi:DNA-binding transcriptional LysR family regulator
MVRLGVGWTVLPVIQAERGPDPLRRAVRGVLTTRTLAAVQRADRAPTPAADALVGFLNEGQRRDSNRRSKAASSPS